MPRPIAALPCLVALGATLAAQERRPAFGIVVDDTGKPAAAVPVRCVGTPWFGEIDGPTDRVETTTDARGRFVVRLLADRSYSAWADAAAAGTLSVSALAELVAGGDVALQLSARQPRPRIELRGADAWVDVGPLQLEAAPFGHGVLRVPVTDTLLPPLPSPMLLLARTRDGEVVWTQSIGHVDTRIFPGWVDARADAAAIGIDLPPPQLLGIRVMSAGKPVAGAEVWYSPGMGPDGFRYPDAWIRQPMRSELRRIGTTGTDGMAQLRVPAHIRDGKVSPVHLQVRAAGHAWINAGIAGPPYAGGEGLKVPADQVLPVALAPESTVRVHPPRRCSLLVLGERMANTQHTEQILPVQTDAQGRAVLPLRREPTARDCWLVRVLPEGETMPIWTSPVPGDDGFRIDLRSRLVTVQVRDARGGPPQGARTVVLPLHHNLTLSDVPLPLDGAGRGGIRLGPGGWLVLASAGHTVAWHALQPGDTDHDLVLDLRDMPDATVRIVDPLGKPAAHRVCYVGVSGVIVRRDPPEPEVEMILFERMRALWPMHGASTDADGCLRFPILVSSWSWRASTQGSPPVTLEVGKTVEIMLR